ncbi:PE family protein PE27A, partial [Mycobacterium tuberculosis M1959]
MTLSVVPEGLAAASAA